jgi:hypothetical protein
LPPQKTKARKRSSGTASSPRRPDIRVHIEQSVQDLVELYEGTDPRLGAASEQFKLEHARAAIEIWWQLFDILLLWAQSQLAGYEYLRGKHDLLKRFSKKFRCEISMDSHILEYIGLTFAHNRVNRDDRLLTKIEDEMAKYNVKLDTTRKRYFIRELLGSRSAGSSFWRLELQSALFALNLGHVEDVLKPVSVRRQGNPVELLNWKVRTLQHVYFHVGRGMKKHRALQLIGDALGQSPETLRSWEKFVDGDDDIMMSLHAARIAGRWEGDLDNCLDKEIIERYGATYHRDVSDIELARSALKEIRSTTLDAIRAGIRHSRARKRSTRASAVP